MSDKSGMTSVGFEILVILILIAANGVFALSEIALVSARKHRLQQQARKGKRNAAIALDLASKPNELLSTAQIGITFIGTLAGAFGGATIAEDLAKTLNALPWIAPHGESVAVAGIVIAISGLSIILGELVPKRLALSNPELFASAMAPFMRRLSKLARPAVAFLGWCTNLVLKLLPRSTAEEKGISEEEIKILIRQGAEAGALKESEQEMVEGVFDLGNRRVPELMTPRRKIVWMDVNSSAEKVWATVTGSPYSRFPAGDGSLDAVIGFVHVKDLLVQSVAGRAPDIRSCLRDIPSLPESVRAFAALERFQESGTHIALVVNEHGGTEGLITLHDLMEAVMGEFPGKGEFPSPSATRREDGSWLIDGAIPIFELKELLGIALVPWEDEGSFTTLGGFILRQLDRIPSPSDHFESAGWRFEVVDMDGNRIDKVLVSRVPSPPGPEQEPGEPRAEGSRDQGTKGKG